MTNKKCLGGVYPSDFFLVHHPNNFLFLSTFADSKKQIKKEKKINKEINYSDVKHKKKKRLSFSLSLSLTSLPTQVWYLDRYPSFGQTWGADAPYAAIYFKNQKTKNETKNNKNNKRERRDRKEREREKESETRQYIYDDH